MLNQADGEPGDQSHQRRTKHYAAKRRHRAGSVARKSVGVARIMGRVMNNVDLRKTGDADNEQAEQHGKQRWQCGGNLRWRAGPDRNRLRGR